jgi:DNA modification methylase
MEKILNKILNEDMLKGIDKVPNNFVDLIVTDPPLLFRKGLWK